jgi:hypothetical protein
VRSLEFENAGFDFLMTAASILPLTRDSAFLRSFGWKLDLDRASAIENGGAMFIWTSPYNLIRYTTSTAMMIVEMVHPEAVREYWGT